MTDGKLHRFTFTAGSFGPDDVDVAMVHGSEAISEPFSFEIDVVARNADAAAVRKALGGRGQLTFPLPNARRITGIVTRVEAHPAVHGKMRYRLRLAPTLWLLSRRKTSRIFQDTSVPDIVRAVLSESRVEQDWRIEGSYPKREYCVQYRESDLDFVTRLLAEEGIFYFIRDPSTDDAEAKETVVFADTVAAYGAIAGDSKLPFRRSGALHSGDEVSWFSFGEEIRSGATVHRSYDFKRPFFDLRGEARLGGQHASLDLTELAIYEHDGDPEEGRIHATGAEASLEQLRARSATGTGESNCQRLALASTFELLDHPHDDLCRRYALVRVDHEIHQVAGPTSEGGHPEETYKARFHCVPEHVAFRPERPRRDLHQVTETATVVGPAGEEIHVDRHGRIKVQFHWDLQGKNDENSSCWLRSMQPWAGPSWGSQFIPRIGMEVVVTFVGGDIDRPMVLGTVYNAHNPPPFGLPEHKTQSGIRTRSTPGGGGANELRFEDAKDQEQIYLHAQKDLDERVENNHTLTVVGDETIQIGRTSRIEVGSDQDVSVDGNEVVTLNKNLVVHIVGKQFIHVEGKDVEGSGHTRAEAPKPDPAAQAPADDQGSSGGPAEMLAQDIFGQKVAAAGLLFLSEQVPDDHYAQGQDICNQVAACQEAVTDLQKEAVALPPSGMGLPNVPLTEDGLMRRLETVRKAAVVRERLDETIQRVNPPLPAPLQALQMAAVEHLHDLDRRAEGVQKGLALAGPEGFRRATFGGMGSRVGGGGAAPPAHPPTPPAPAPAPPPAPSTPAAPPPAAQAPEPKGKTMDEMVKDGKPTLEGFENSKKIELVENDTGFLGAPKGFAIQAGGSTIKIKDGNISLEAPNTISLKAATVTIEAPVVMVKAGMLVESASMINESAGVIIMTASGAITEMAGIITLN